MKNLWLIAVMAMTAMLSSPAAVSADPQSASYVWLVAFEFQCDLPVPNPCPDIAMAPSGDTIEVSGVGELSLHPKSVGGEGTFTHRDPDGNVVGAGTWTATELLTFNDWGGSPLVPSDWRSGVAVIKIHLSSGFDGILKIQCHLPGGFLPHGFHEGVSLAIQGTNLNFNHEVSGVTLFIAL